MKAAKVVEKKAAASKKAKALAEKRLTELEMKLGGTELKLAEVESLNLAQADELADLKAALEACRINGIMKALLIWKTPRSR